VPVTHCPILYTPTTSTSKKFIFGIFKYEKDPDGFVLGILGHKKSPPLTPFAYSVGWLF
jgi:hypothetical protein